MEDGVIVALKHVCFSYDAIPALEDVSIAIEDRDFLGIIGPNGGGKTTLLRLILGLLEPNSGTISVFGRPPKEAKHLIGYVPQHFEFDPDFPISVMEVVLMGRLGKRPLGRSYTQADTQVCLEVLRKVGMEDLRDRQIGNLSGGQLQRALIARALAIEPKLLLLDEPAASIDPEWQHSFFELLSELHREMAIVLVTHDVSVICVYVDRIACVNQRLYYHGPTRDGVHTISEMYHCPVELIAHEVAHRPLGDHDQC